MKIPHSNDWLRTYTGRAITPLDPKPEQVSVEDIIHACSGIGRYNCHTHGNTIYSVAQHSVLVSYLCDPIDAKWGLMHDATEAFIGDVIRPIRRLIQGYDGIEANLWKVIWRKYAIGGPMEEMPPSVKYADNAILVLEARDLFGEDAFKAWKVPEMALPSYIPPIIPWNRKTSKRMFLRRFLELFGPLAKFGDVYVGPGGCLKQSSSHTSTPED